MFYVLALFKHFDTLLCTNGTRHCSSRWKNNWEFSVPINDRKAWETSNIMAHVHNHYQNRNTLSDSECRRLTFSQRLSVKAEEPLSKCRVVLSASILITWLIYTVYLPLLNNQLIFHLLCAITSSVKCY